MKSILDLLAKRRRRVVGLMSGTSADGVDAALVEIESLPVKGGNGRPLTWDVLDFMTLPYPDAVRAEILDVQQGGDRVLERLTRLHFILGHLFADAVEAVSRDAGVPLSEVDAVASHGQTVCHFPVFPFAGPPREGQGAESWGRANRGGAGWVSASTLQIGEPAVLAERLGVCVISNFRSRDVVAGGTGAPLVPLVDHLLFADAARSRMALNVGGIANVTAIRAGAGRDEVIAFDTGPGNMVLDALMGIVSDGRKHVDEGGALASKGNPDREIVDAILEDPFFAQAPPRAAGREQFGAEFTRAFVDRCRAKKLSDASVLSTATMLTARAVEQAYRRFIAGFAIQELIGQRRRAQRDVAPLSLRRLSRRADRHLRLLRLTWTRSGGFRAPGPSHAGGRGGQSPRSDRCVAAGRTRRHHAGR
jgi:anhydro-N-acetylmuramic acid kinase